MNFQVQSLVRPRFWGVVILPLQLFWGREKQSSEDHEEAEGKKDPCPVPSLITNTGSKLILSSNSSETKTYC